MTRSQECHLEILIAFHLQLMPFSKMAAAFQACLSLFAGVITPSNTRLPLLNFQNIFRMCYSTFLFFEVYTNMHCLLLSVRKLQNHHLKAKTKGHNSMSSQSIFTKNAGQTQFITMIVFPSFSVYKICIVRRILQKNHSFWL